MLAKMFNDLVYLNNLYNPIDYNEVVLKDNVLTVKVLMTNSVKEDIKVTLTDKVLKVYKLGSVANERSEYKLVYYLNIEKYKLNKDKCSSKYEGEMLYINLPLVVEEEFNVKLE